MPNSLVKLMYADWKLGTKPVLVVQPVKLIFLGSKQMSTKFLPPAKQIELLRSVKWKSLNLCGQSYKYFTIVNYDSRVVMWGILQSGTTLES